MRSPRKSAPTWLSVFALALLVSSAVLLIGARSAQASPQTRVALGGQPVGAALDFSNHDIYIANTKGYVLVFDPGTNTVVKNITTGGRPTYIAYDNATDDLFVTNSSDVIVISGSTNAVVGKILTPNYSPIGIVAGNGEVFVTGAYGVLKVVNTTTLNVMANIVVPSAPPGIPAYDPVNNRVYVPDLVYNGNYGTQVSVVDLGTRTVVDNVTVPNGPFLAAYGFGKVYVTEVNASDLTVIDPASNRVVSTIKTDYGGDGVAFTYRPAIVESASLAIFGGPSEMGSITFLDPFTGLSYQVVVDDYGPAFAIYDPWNSAFYVIDYEGYIEVFPWNDSTNTTVSSTTPTTSTTASTTTTTTPTSMSTSTTSSSSIPTTSSSGTPTTTSGSTATSISTTSPSTSSSATTTTSTTSQSTTPAGSGNPIPDWIFYLLLLLILGAILYGYWRYRKGSNKDDTMMKAKPQT